MDSELGTRAATWPEAGGRTGPQSLDLGPHAEPGTGKAMASVAAVAGADAREAPVVFEVDHFDREHRTGWSVILRGRDSLSALGRHG